MTTIAKQTAVHITAKQCRSGNHHQSCISNAGLFRPKPFAHHLENHLKSCMGTDLRHTKRTAAL